MPDTGNRPDIRIPRTVFAEIESGVRACLVLARDYRVIVEASRALLIQAEKEVEDVPTKELRAALSMPALKGTRIKASYPPIDIEELEALRRVAACAEELSKSEEVIPEGMRQPMARLVRMVGYLHGRQGIDLNREVLERARALVRDAERCEDCGGKVGIPALRKALGMTTRKEDRGKAMWHDRGPGGWGEDMYEIEETEAPRG